jgi:hypothetical protein
MCAKSFTSKNLAGFQALILAFWSSGLFDGVWLIPDSLFTVSNLEPPPPLHC